jgi:hypothetical protein
MALQTGDQMGYASPKTVRAVISRFRDQWLPQPLTPDSIQRVGVTESLAPRTIQTLKLLGLIDEDGLVTEQFERLRRVPTSDFKAELVSMLRASYAPVFEVLEPSGASYEQVQDAFRTFKPEGQRDRMVSLFLGLLDYAEYSQDLPTPRAADSGRSTAPSHTSTPRPKKDKPFVHENNVKRNPPPPLDTQKERGERVEVRLGSAGSVVAYVDVRWLELPADTFAGLRQAIESIKALGYENPEAAANKNGPSEEGPSGQPSGDGGGVTPK